MFGPRFPQFPVTTLNSAWFRSNCHLGSNDDATEIDQVERLEAIEDFTAVLNEGIGWKNISH